MDNSVKKVHCNKCDKLILEITYNKTGGYCYPCYNAIKSKEREEYIRKNRKDIDLYEGVENPVEIIKIMHKDKKYDPLIRYINYPKSKEEMYNNLSYKEIQELKEYAISLFSSDVDKCIEILLHLVCLRGVNINEFLKVLIMNNELSEPSLFLGASDEIAEMLLNKLNTYDGSVDLNHILLGLSMIGNDRVVETFNKWKKKEPCFSNEIYIKPYDYSYEGGWKIDENGKRKNLYYDKSYITSNETNKSSLDVSFFVKEKEKCRYCKEDLYSLFKINSSDFITKLTGLMWDKMNIASCVNCTCYGHIYTDFDTKGNINWSESNVIPDYLPMEEYDEDEFKQIYMDDHAMLPSYASNQFLDVKFTKIGGMPAWVQSAEYPVCPKCNNDMMFVGQVSLEYFEEYGEGIFYGFICEDCKTAATVYQQT